MHKDFHCGAMLSQKKDSFSLQKHVIIAWIVDSMEPIENVSQRSLVIWVSVYNISITNYVNSSKQANVYAFHK